MWNQVICGRKEADSLFLAVFGQGWSNAGFITTLWIDIKMRKDDFEFKYLYL